MVLDSQFCIWAKMWRMRADLQVSRGRNFWQRGQPVTKDPVDSRYWLRHRAATFTHLRKYA